MLTLVYNILYNDSFKNYNNNNDDVIMMLLLMLFVRCKLIRLCCQDKPDERWYTQARKGLNYCIQRFLNKNVSKHSFETFPIIILGF